MEMFHRLKVINTKSNTENQPHLKGREKKKTAQKDQLLDQIMFINVLRKSPWKQFAGELTDLQSFLTEVPA